MRRLIPWSLVLVLSITCLTQSAMMGNVECQENKTPEWKIYEIDDLLKERRTSKRSYLPFLRIPSLHTGIYSLPKGGKDGQQPHGQDEIYYVLSGKAKMDLGEGDSQTTKNIQKGSVIFIKAQVEHRFVDISEDLELLVFFSTAESK